MGNNYLLIDAEDNFEVLKSAASRGGVKILKLLHQAGGLNVNQIAERLGQPQSSVSNHVQSLEQAGLIRTEAVKARKGSQKICYAVYDEIVVSFHKPVAHRPDDVIEVNMPLGLFTNASVAGPCGICSPEGIIGLLDVPTTFLDPERMKASLLWFTSGFVEYQFPNNALLTGLDIDRVEFAMEVSSEVPGTHTDWPSDISVAINGTELGVWTSPGDFGDKRGVYTPDWWKMAGSQYGLLKTWQVTHDGSFVDGRRISDISLSDLALGDHRSVRLRIAVKPDARHPGGINVFGRGFGNYDQDIVMRLHTKSKS
ncbi:MAG: winged helix-turn-helix transcriptional regulator [Loktanella sp.]|nr:winged helix-turn-helix transcriptional regulator [Loktanella sp.]